MEDPHKEVRKKVLLLKHFAEYLVGSQEDQDSDQGVKAGAPTSM